VRRQPVGPSIGDGIAFGSVGRLISGPALALSTEYGWQYPRLGPAELCRWADQKSGTGKEAWRPEAEGQPNPGSPAPFMYS